MAPLIGITSAVYYDKNNWKFLRAYALNVKAIERVGGIPVIIPCTLNDDTLRQLYERLDGILLPGGGDVDPAFYQAEPQATLLKMIDRERDAVEIKISRWAVADQRPVLGICRGHQVFNVAMGGTLIQDIPAFVGHDLRHDISDGMPRNTRLHDVTINPESRLANILNGTHFDVNSIHHQSIERLAPGLTATAYATDGVIEATEIESHPFALTVQWHPEDMVDDDETMVSLFSAFVNAAQGQG